MTRSDSEDTTQRAPVLGKALDDLRVTHVENIETLGGGAISQVFRVFSKQIHDKASLSKSPLTLRPTPTKRNRWG
jgi:hypothetical protein